nr:CASP-like protein 5A1 [Malus domestica]
MYVSRPLVHPVEAPPTTDVAAQNALRVRMKDVQGMPGTPDGLSMRLCQLCFAALGTLGGSPCVSASSTSSQSLSVMATTSDFPTVATFCYLVAAISLQCVWSLSMVIVDLYALLVGRSLHNCKAVCFFTIGDGVKHLGPQDLGGRALVEEEPVLIRQCWRQSEGEGSDRSLDLTARPRSCAPGAKERREKRRQENLPHQNHPLF